MQFFVIECTYQAGSEECPLAVWLDLQSLHFQLTKDSNFVAKSSSPAHEKPCNSSNN